MTEHKNNYIWYGLFGEPYKGIEPAFFNTENLSWTKILENNAQTIIDELKVVFQEKNGILKPYFSEDMQSKKNNWRTIGFYFWGKKNHAINKMFPKTSRILKQIPNIISASINMLEAHSEIKPHFGDTNAIYRCHFGLQIPEGLPLCGFKVENEWRRWEEGKILVFLDAYTHSSINDTDKNRFILLIDVIRPEFVDNKTKICSFVLTMLTMYRISEVFPVIKKLANLPAWALKIMFSPLQLLWLLYVPIQNRIGFIWNRAV
jgi:aspartyl/asparaginyl beta-hydroxylase (cupin superfamily)